MSTMDDQACPRCKTTKYRNPSLKLLVNVCGHALCESCVDLLFLKGSGSCPECNVPLRRNNFRVQLFEDSRVEKEVDIRRRVLRDFNKREEDFATLREYNDYLEEVESIIYNLTNDIEIVATNQRIEQFKRDNREVIARNKARLGRDELELEELLEEEKMLEHHRKRSIVDEELEEKKKKIRSKEALIDELMFSSENAQNILETFAHNAQKEKEEALKVQEIAAAAAPPVAATQFSTGIRIGMKSNQGGFLPVPKADDTPLYHYKKPVVDTDGPQPPTWSQVERDGYIAHVRAASSSDRAGGYLTQMACLRALQEALNGLYNVAERRWSEDNAAL
ncbi:hypothetical protein B566_EDAN007239 [Ephemera danica]|nr:hypothetical protein B566_EDAN007239 [Ephemera danica]